jgi:hypothetical protein
MGLTMATAPLWSWPAQAATRFADETGRYCADPCRLGCHVKAQNVYDVCVQLPFMTDEICRQKEQNAYSQCVVQCP